MLTYEFLKRAVSGTTGVNMLVKESTEMNLYGWMHVSAIK
jgi:hypothetical protein